MNNTVKYFGLLVGLLLTWGVNGQDGNFPKSMAGTGTIYGKVVSETSAEPIAYANVILKKNKIVQTFSTKEAGRFIFRNVPFGQYVVEVSFLGLETLSKEIKLTEANPIANLGQMELADFKMEEIIVSGEKNAEQNSLVKRIYNVGKDINSTGGSALDALKNIPSLNVDMDGKIQLRGSSNVKVLINGRPSSISGSGGEMNLESIPAGSIESIEVITNPSAKYEAAGKSGIINIVMKKPRNMGFNYSFNFLVGTEDKWSTGIAMNYRTHKWNWKLGYQFYRKFTPGSILLDRQNIFSDTTNYLHEIASIEKLKIGHTPSVGVDFNPTKKLMLFASFTTNPHSVQKKSKYDYVFMNEAKEYDSNRDRLTQDDEAENATQAEFGINKKFARKGMTWNTVYSYDKGTKQDSVYSLDERYIDENLQEVVKQKNRRDQYDITHRVQSDFVYPLTQKTKLESGLLFSSRLLDNNYTFFDKDASSENWEPVPLRSNDFLFTEKISSGYVMGTTKWQKWALNAGVRVEHTEVTADPSNYTHFFPSGYLAYTVFPKGKGKVMVSYSRRIHRPSYKRLNPFASYNDDLNIRRGNAQLKPELTDSWELGWQSHWKKGSISPTIFYRYTDDKIGYYAHLLPDGVRELTYVNLNSSIAKGAELNGSYSPVKSFRLSGNMSYFNVEKDGENLENNTSNSGNMFSSRLMISYKPTHRLATQFTGFYHSGYIGTVGYGEPMKNMDFGTTYQVFQKRGKLIFKISDVFDSREFSFHVRTSDMKMDFTRRMHNRTFWLGFNWELKQDKSKQRRKRSHSSRDMDL